MREGTLDSLPDEDLIRLALSDPDRSRGSEAASVLLERYRDRVYVWCYRLVRDHEQALDLAQESLIKAYRGLGGFRGHSAFASWLFAITRNACLSALRRPSLVWDGEDGVSEIADPGPRPDEALETRLDEERALEMVRRHLDPLEMEAIWLRCYEGLPVDEITRLLSIDAATGARSILQRARRKLRAALAEGARTTSERGGPFS